MMSTTRLLVVDDEPIVCDSCTRIFEPRGFRVDAVNDSRQGLQLARENSYSAILVDFMMPGMDGLEFLEAIRKANPSTPVIIITGYSTIPSAAKAMRLGAVDYIPKPFSPEEITEAVQRVAIPQIPEKPPTAHTTRGSSTSIVEIDLEEASPDHPALFGVLDTEGYHPEEELSFPRVPDAADDPMGLGDLRFVGDAWMRVESDGLVRVGAFLSGMESGQLGSIRVPRVGDVVHRGLPLAMVNAGAADGRILRSPLTGEIVAVNPNLARNSVGEWDWSRRGAWIARVRPTDLERDLAASCTREVVVASSDSHASAGLRQALGLLGCRVTAAQGCSATLESLRASGADLVLIDAPSLQREGPALVESINTFCPDARVVVVEDPESPRESAYRSLRILFYAVRPLNYQELIDILETAFHSPEPLLPAPSSANYLPKAAHCIRFTDRQGCAVSLIASGSILNPGSGLGRCLIEHLLREGYPVEVDYGARIHGPRHLLEARENNGLVVELKASRSGRLPGMLARVEGGGVARSSAGALGRFVALSIEAAPGTRESMEFDPATTRALAERIAQELTGGGAAGARGPNT